MRNKILRFFDFVSESKINEANDTPETYIKGKLMQLKRAIDKLFEEGSESEEEQPETISVDKAKQKGGEKKEKVSLASQGVVLDSSEVSLYSQTDDTLTVKYSDQEGTYNLLFSINIKDGMAKDPNADFSSDDINKISVKFKKYTIDDIDLIGQINYTLNVETEGNEFLFNLNGGENKEQGQDQGQGQEAQEKPKESEGGGEKMTLMELLEFLKSEFDDKYGENKGLEYDTE